MKKVLNFLVSLGLRKILGFGSILLLLVLLVLGPTALKNPQKVLITNTANKVPQIASTKVTDSPNTTPTNGFDPSYFNVTPVTLPDGSVTFPTYTVPTPTYTSPKISNDPNVVTPDPSKCSSIQASMDAVTAPYVDKDNQLRTEINSLEQQLIAMTTINRSQDTSPGIVYTLPDTTALQNKLQADDNQIMNDIQNINSQLAPYQKQYVANACT